MERDARIRVFDSSHYATWSTSVQQNILLDHRKVWDGWSNAKESQLWSYKRRHSGAGKSVKWKKSVFAHQSFTQKEGFKGNDVL